MEELMSTIANIGFPIAMATYLLIRIEEKLTTLTDCINGLSKSIESLK